ncbi:MAG: hypothetical protein PHQ96_08445 [Candidatus Omnitrophica bacterium]|nr:hypothetical protein [Candidatus Omnitrophota bacterium]
MDFNILFDAGSPYRLWPYSDGNELIMTLSTAKSGDYLKKTELYIESNKKFRLLKNFYTENKSATTTGQPFISKEGYYFVAVWDVDYYNFGASYGAIYLSKDKGNSWEKAYEDESATYLNHFYQEETGGIYIGAGVGKKDKDKFGTTPERGFVLRSQDKGLTWNKMIDYDKPAALYSIVKFQDNIVISTREQKSLLVLKPDRCREIFLNAPTRSANVIDEALIISSDNSFIYSYNLKEWKTHSFEIKAVLRYPIKTKKYVIFGGVGTKEGRKAYLFATDMRDNYFFEFSNLCSGDFSRLAVHAGNLYAGTECDGKLISLAVEEIEFKKIKNGLSIKSFKR